MTLKENMMGIQHIGIPTNSMEKTKEFYQKIGFEIQKEYLNGDEKVCFLKLGNLVIETYENGCAEMKSGAINHFAINVKDIEQAYEDIRKKKLSIVEEITGLPFGENGVKFFIIEGPNSERVEFNQYL